MKLHKIDRMKPSRMKLYLWIKYATKYDVMHMMPEIPELYYSLKQREEITQQDWDKMITGTYLEVI